MNIVSEINKKITKIYFNFIDAMTLTKDNTVGIFLTLHGSVLLTRSH